MSLLWSVGKLAYAPGCLQGSAGSFRQLSAHRGRQRGPGAFLRVVERDGDTWFVATDVAKALGYERPNDAVNTHCKKVNKFSYGDSPYPYNIIPASDVYRLALRSNLASAERFQDWVCEDILPSIAKHGVFATQAKSDEVKIFEHNEFGNLRVVERDGETWFVAADVCRALGLDTSNLSKVLDEDERGSYTIRTPGGPQFVSIISESGLYSLVLRSRKPEAKPFRRWVTHDILPSIAKHGVFATQAKSDEVKIFEHNEFGNLRVVERDGETWFVATDVCRALGLGNVSRALESLDDDEKGMSIIHTPGGTQEMLIISESGLYSLVLRRLKRYPTCHSRQTQREAISLLRVPQKQGKMRLKF